MSSSFKQLIVIAQLPMSLKQRSPTLDHGAINPPSKFQTLSTRNECVASINASVLPLERKPIIYFHDRTHEDEKLEKCVDWCKETNKGPKNAFKALKCVFVEHNKLARVLKLTQQKGGIYNSNVCRNKKRIMALEEEKQFAEFVRVSGISHNGKTRAELQAEIVRVLQLRKAQNLQGGRKYIPLTTLERGVLAKKTVGPDWFRDFYRHHSDLKECYARDEDAARHDAGSL